MNKYYFISAILSLSLFCINPIYAQTEEEKAEALKPLEKTLLAQLKIASLLKDANTIKKASVILKYYNDIQTLDSIDVELLEDQVISIIFYEKDKLYEHKNKFSVIVNINTKTTEVEKSANTDLKLLTNGDSRKSKYEKCISLSKGYRVLFKRDIFL
jgi:hypothetical protein